jgi:hypothetical protein
MNEKTLPPLIFLALAGPLQAADHTRGAGLHNGNCLSCHDDSVYTREERRMKTLPGLRKQVRRCELALGLRWFDEDIDAVTGFLNDRFYHLPEK